jgi:hypothetical protein
MCGKISGRGETKCSEKNSFHCINPTGFNPLNAELNSISHLLAFLGAHHIFHVSRIGVEPEPSRCELCD